MISIADALARKQQSLPQLDYLFMVELPSIGSVGSFDPTSNNSMTKNISRDSSQSYKIDPEEISHRVYAVNAPFVSHETVKYSAGQGFFYHARSTDISSMNMKIDEYEDGLTLNYLIDWQKMIKNPDSSYNPPAYYKRDIRVIKISGTNLALHYSIYKGFFPADIAPSSFNHDSGGVLQYDVNFVGDGVDHVFIPDAEVKKMVQQAQPSLDYDKADKISFWKKLKPEVLIDMVTTFTGL